MLCVPNSRACNQEMEVEAMKKAQGLRLLGSCLVLVLLTGALTSAIRNRASAKDSIKSVTVSSSGQRLTTFFEGLPHDARYSLKALLAARRALPRCGRKPEEPGIVQSLFGSGVVYANCHFASCGGDGWVDHYISCDAGGGCSGIYDYADNDGLSPYGSYQSIFHCGSLPECGCESPTC
jgi:hypothetical protein